MLAIMQGRLVPPVGNRIQAFPRESWAEEFPRAASAGLSAIEWIYDAYGAGINPIETSEGILQIHALSVEHHVSVRSVCADYFMEYSLVSSNIDDLIALLGWARQLSARRIVLPFVDASAIREAEHGEAVIDALLRALPVARGAGIELHLETSLNPEAFAALLARIPDASIKVNYDSGNSASLGYRAAEEFEAYGKRIGSVHLKDRVRGGGTVPLGQGDADFEAVFTGLRRLGYSGDFVLQVARGETGDEIAWARRNREFVERYLD